MKVVGYGLGKRQQELLEEFKQLSFDSTAGLCEQRVLYVGKDHQQELQHFLREAARLTEVIDTVKTRHYDLDAVETHSDTPASRQHLD